LDVLTMLLASNQGNEGALRLAAEAGDGRLFIELRRRMLEAATAGRPAVTALATLGHDLGLVELTEIAASASLATSQGAPVARSLTAKTESLRSALQAEQEADARVRTGKITFPLVAMGLVFIVLGLYPALVTIRNT
jgi:tight adherence protein C